MARPKKPSMSPRTIQRTPQHIPGQSWIGDRGSGIGDRGSGIIRSRSPRSYQSSLIERFATLGRERSRTRGRLVARTCFRTRTPGTPSAPLAHPQRGLRRARARRRRPTSPNTSVPGMDDAQAHATAATTASRRGSSIVMPPRLDETSSPGMLRPARFSRTRGALRAVLIDPRRLRLAFPYDCVTRRLPSTSRGREPSIRHSTGIRPLCGRSARTAPTMARPSTPCRSSRHAEFTDRANRLHRADTVRRCFSLRIRERCRDVSRTLGRRGSRLGDDRENVGFLPFLGTDWWRPRAPGRHFPARLELERTRLARSTMTSAGAAAISSRCARTGLASR